MTLREAVAARNDLVEYGWCVLTTDRSYGDVQQVIGLIPARVRSTWDPATGWTLRIVREEAQ